MAEDKGVMLIPRNFVFPTARFLTQEEQEIYEDVIRKYSGKAKQNLDISRQGSNLFKVLELDEIFPDNKRVTTSSDWQQIIETNPDYLRGVYVDAPAVVLRSAGDSYSSNDFLAKDLAKQIKIRTFKNPIVITGLKIKDSKESNYGLRFITADKTEFYEAPELSHENNGRRFSGTNERGLPIFEKNGNRTLYTRNNGLSSLCLDGLSDLDSCGVVLAGSLSVGRVVVVDAEGVAHENLDVLRKQTNELLEKQKKERQDLISKLKA